MADNYRWVGKHSFIFGFVLLYQPELSTFWIHEKAFLECFIPLDITLFWERPGYEKLQL